MQCFARLISGVRRCKALASSSAVMRSRAVRVNCLHACRCSQPPPRWPLRHQMYIFPSVINTRGVIGRGRDDIGSISRNDTPPAGALSLTVSTSLIGCQACFNSARLQATSRWASASHCVSGLVSSFVGIISDAVAVLNAVGIVFMVLSLTQIHIRGAG